MQLTLQMLEMLLDPETGPREPESGEEPHKVREHDRRKHGRAPLAEHLPRVEIELLPSEWKSKLSEAATPASFVEVTSQVVATAEPEGCVVELAVGRVLVRVRRRGTPR